MPDNPTSPLRVALVGCGRISSVHIDGLAQLPGRATLHVVADADLERAKATAAAHGVPHALADFDAMLQMDDIDAVILCSPNSLHYEHALKAMQAGKHVLLEKPMAETAAQARHLADVSRSTGCLLAIAQSFRHSPAIRYFQDNREQFGALRSVEVSLCVFWDGPQAPWWADRTPEEGVILSLFAPHALDFVQMVMVADPLQAHAVAARWQDGWQGEDEAAIVLSYSGGRIGLVHVSYNTRPSHNRQTLFFDRGVLVLENSDTVIWNGEVLFAPDPNATDAPSLSATYRTQIAEFIQALNNEPHRLPLADEGARLIELIDRVKQSVHANGIGRPAGA